MKILVTIPHFYRYNPGGDYGSSNESEETRLNAFRKAITGLRHRFGMPHSYMRQAYEDKDGVPPYILHEPADTKALYDIDICVCTVPKYHLMEKLADRRLSAMFRKTNALTGRPLPSVVLNFPDVLRVVRSKFCFCE